MILTVKEPVKRTNRLISYRSPVTERTTVEFAVFINYIRIYGNIICQNSFGFLIAVAFVYKFCEPVKLTRIAYLINAFGCTVTVQVVLIRHLNSRLICLARNTESVYVGVIAHINAAALVRRP